jgi:hypothetical protein
MSRPLRGSHFEPSKFKGRDMTSNLTHTNLKNVCTHKAFTEVQNPAGELSYSELSCSTYSSYGKLSTVVQILKEREGNNCWIIE